MSTTDYKLFTADELFVVRWHNPTKSAARSMVPLVEQYHREVGEQLFLAIVIGADCPPPDKNTSAVLHSQHDRIHDLTRTVRLVVIGHSFRQTIMRSVVTTGTLVAGLRGRPFTVDKSIPVLADAAAEALGCDADALLRKMVANGIIDAEEAGFAPS